MVWSGSVGHLGTGEEGDVAGIFGIQVDLSGEQGRADDQGRPEAEAALHAQAKILKPVPTASP
jgi:hypothetical protein